MSASPANLANKVAIITGAGSGIGKASALRFAREGASVIVNDINAGHAAATVKQIVDNGGRATVSIADVTQVDQVRAMIGDAVVKFGRLDILFNNAGGAFPKPTHETSPDEYRAIVALNLDSV